jgi:hypothetical protein
MPVLRLADLPAQTGLGPLLVYQGYLLVLSANCW